MRAVRQQARDRPTACVRIEDPVSLDDQPPRLVEGVLIVGGVCGGSLSGFYEDRTGVGGPRQKYRPVDLDVGLQPAIEITKVGQHKPEWPLCEVGGPGILEGGARNEDLSITTRMGLWLNPRVDAATAVSDFDLRDLKHGRLSLYLGATPDNLLRVQPLYALLFQQLVDLNSRSLPSGADRPTLVVLDEFARLGAAPILAHAFSWVAGYGFRLLAVLQSPSQLRGLYGPDLADEIVTNCGVEVVFAPKELRIAQELSDRLGFYTTPGRSRSRPTGLGKGRRSVTVSDQRRALMLPQELMQLPSQALIVLKAGVPAVRGRKIVFYREALFKRRLRPSPVPPVPPSPPSSPQDRVEEDPLNFDVIARAFAAEGLPPPELGADEAEVAAWLDRVVDAAPMESVG